jgi:hypothetical protein
MPFIGKWQRRNPMAVHDQPRRTPRDYMHGARTRYNGTTPAARWTAVIVALALLAFIAYLLFAAANPSVTGDAVRVTPPPATAPGAETAPAAPTTQPQ